MIVRPKSMPAVTPPAVMTRPSRTTRPGVGTAPNPDSRSFADQWLVALRPFRSPAAPSTSDPVHTEVT